MITGEKVDVLAPRAQIVLQIFLVFSAHDSAAEKIAFHPSRELGIIEGCFSPFAAHHTTPGLFFSPFTYNPGLFF